MGGKGWPFIVEIGGVRMRYFMAGLSFLVVLVSWPAAEAQINFPSLARAESLDCVFLTKTFGYWNGEKVYAGVVETASEPETLIHLDPLI